MPMQTENKSFPGPYLSKCSIEDPIMKRVDVHKTEIGSRSSGLPKGMMDEGMSIEHVGEVAGKKG